jgi:hypothetical protein
MPYFKFLQTRHLETTLNGNFLFRRLSYYRLLEAATKNKHIGDMNEGRAVTKIDLQPNDGNDDFRKNLHLIGIQVANNKARINGISNRTIDCFAFCVSKGTLNRLKAAMCFQPEPEYAYDACIRIVSLQELATAIWETGFHHPSGRRISDLFYPPSVGTVTYGDSNASDRNNQNIAMASPFFKMNRYEYQSEARIVLFPKTEVAGLDFSVKEAFYQTACSKHSFLALMLRLNLESNERKLRHQKMN